MKISFGWKTTPVAEEIAPEISSAIGMCRTVYPGTSNNEPGQSIFFVAEKLTNDGHHAIESIRMALFYRYRIIPEVLIDGVELAMFAAYQEAQIEELKRIAKAAAATLLATQGKRIKSGIIAQVRTSLEQVAKLPRIKQPAR